MPEVKAESVITAISNQRNNALNEAAQLHALLADALSEIEELKTKLLKAQEQILEVSGLSLVDEENPKANTPAS